VINYGKAQAGILTPDNLCDKSITKWLCSGADGVQWWEAAGAWATFVRGLVVQLQTVEDPKEWPAAVSSVVELAEQLAEKFDGGHPWVILESEIGAWAESQQYFRDVAGMLATHLAELGQTVPPAPGQLQTASKAGSYVAIGAVGTLAAVGLIYWIAKRRAA